MDIKVWYSPATDVTGKKLVEALEAAGGTKKPAGTQPVLCWGAKTKKDVDFGARKVYNHPNNIRLNRHKYKALEKMRASGVRVAPYTNNADQVGGAAGANIPYPVVARTNYHQGGAGFWLCLNKLQLDRAIEEGAQYFQEFINVKAEYRLHVVDGKVIYAVKKVPRTNLTQAFTKHWEDHVKHFAEKRDIAVDQATLDLVLERFARKMATSVDMITRSNTRGWKFSRVNVAQLSDDLKAQAINAVKALDLDFAAVDCCLDTANDAYVIECNTGPGLDGSSFDAWLKALKKMLADENAPVAPKKAKGGFKEVKAELKKKANALAKMIEAAEDEDQVALIKEMWAKI